MGIQGKSNLNPGPGQYVVESSFGTNGPRYKAPTARKNTKIKITRSPGPGSYDVPIRSWLSVSPRKPAQRSKPRISIQISSVPGPGSYNLKPALFSLSARSHTVSVTKRKITTTAKPAPGYVYLLLTIYYRPPLPTLHHTHKTQKNTNKTYSLYQAGFIRREGSIWRKESRKESKRPLNRDVAESTHQQNSRPWTWFIRL